MSSIRYMAKNHVAANLLMLVLVLGGLLVVWRGVKVEVFPEIELDRIIVTVPYPGASPDETEQGIVRPIEEAVSGVDGVKRVLSIASEGSGMVMIEIVDGVDIDTMLQDIKSAVDNIVTFPEDAERPIVQKMTNRKEVISVVVAGDLTPRQLRQQCEQVRDDLQALPNITQVEVVGVPNYEISIEISEEKLREHKLTLDAVAASIKALSVDLPAGGIKTRGGEVLIRTKERRYTGREYEKLTIISKPDGTRVKLGDIATVKDTFEETDLSGRFDGKPAALVQVFREGDQSPNAVSSAVKTYLAKRKEDLPAGVNMALWFDRSEILQARMDLLTKNAGLGLILVILVLGLFLEPKLAFWVTLGIPISVLGAFLIMPSAGVTINMISLFAFILVLGIVVDDAIVVGENIHYHRSKQKNFLEAAVIGAKEVGRPVTFSVLTTMAAFAPLLFVSGIMGKFMWSIPVIVIGVLGMSLVESLLVLPAHLSGKVDHVPEHTPQTDEQREAEEGAPYRTQADEAPEEPPPAQVKRLGPIARFHAQVARGLDWVIFKPYLGTLKLALKFRYTTVAFGLVSLFLTIGLFAGGFVKFIFMPEIEGDLVRARLVMPYGTPVAETQKHIDRMTAAAKQLIAKYDKDRNGKQKDSESILRNIASVTGGNLGVGGGPMSRGGASGSHIGEVGVYLVDSGLRNVDSPTFAREWRKLVGEIPGAEEVDYQSQLMRIGAPLALQLAHSDLKTLQIATERLKERLKQYPGLYDIADSFESGKAELQLSIKPEARALGLTAADVGRQVRAAFYGAEALRLQRGRNEVKVMVRYPRSQRRSLADIQSLRLRTPKGVEIPFAQAATVIEGKGYARINRTDRKRTVTIESKADQKVANPAEILADLKATFLPTLMADYPGLTYDLEGEQRERAESLGSLKWGMLAALFLIYGLLAIPFRSYAQPIIIMSAIPFGIIGAVIGHVALGFQISMMSLFGIVALAGVVVNDSLVLVDFVNRNRAPGKSVVDAVLEAA
jgi:multidrug efflux pump subunit AcrB